jgi:hypothetical protein
MAKIKKINVSEIEGNNPGDGASVLPAGVITVYEDTGDYFLRIHDGETDGGVAFNGVSNTGDITFNGLNIIGQGTEGRFGLINLVPAETATGQFGTINYLDAGQYVSIYPTNEFDSPHIHIAAGLGVDSAEGDLFLGDDDKYVQVNHSGVVSIRSNDYQENNAYVWYFRNDGRLELPSGGEIGTYGMGWTGLTNGVQGTPVNLAFLSNDEQNLRHELSYVYLDGDSNSSDVSIGAGTLDVSYQWTFAADGTTEFPNNTLKSPGALSIQTPNSATTVTGLADWNGDSLGGWDQSTYTNLATTTDGAGTGLTVDIVAGSGYIDINAITINNAGSGYTTGDVITIRNENNYTGTFTVVTTTSPNTWSFDITGAIEFPDSTVQTTAWTGISTVSKTGGGEGTETALDLTKTVNKLTDGLYTLADGDEGQIMYLVPKDGATGGGTGITVANGRVLNNSGSTTAGTYTNISYMPFAQVDPNQVVNVVTMIFTDDAWQASSGSWD